MATAASETTTRRTGRRRAPADPGAVAVAPPATAARPAEPLLVVAQDAYRQVAGHVGGLDRDVATAERLRNGELRVRLADPEAVVGRHCAVLGTVAPPDRNLLTYTMVVQALRRAGAGRITAVMPYLAYARQDDEPEGASLGIEWLGDLLAGAGVDDALCLDVHSDAAAQELGLPVRSLDPAPLLAAALPPGWRGADTCFVAPDAGAVDRCARLAEAVGGDRPLAWLEKRRTPFGVEHGEVHGTLARRAVLVDDLVDTGVTLLSACEALRARGVEELAVVATHGVLTGTAWRALWPLGVEMMILTDSVAMRHPHRRELHVVSAGPLLGAALQRMAAGSGRRGRPAPAAAARHGG